jgi:hypothetical protein
MVRVARVLGQVQAVAGVWLVFRNIIAGFRSGETYVSAALAQGNAQNVPRPTGALGDDIIAVVETIQQADQELKQAAEKA